jgi:DNA-binding ferritin-like protein
MDIQLCLSIIVQLRAMQMYTQQAHNLCGRVPFFQDHEFFSETYEQLESDYDSVFERTVGLYGEQSSLELSNLVSLVSSKLKDKSTIGQKENSIYFSTLLEMEKELCVLIEKKVTSKASEGTKQLIGEIANKSEMRQYKIKQRLKK